MSYHQHYNVICCIFVFFHLQSVFGFGGIQSVSCPDPHDIPNHGTRKPLPNPDYTFYDGSYLRYVCYEGYVLQPPNPVQTCEGGVWNPQTVPQCVEDIKCSNPIHVRNGDDWKNGSIDVGTIVRSSQITCHPGFIPDPATPSSTCTSDGTWSNDLACIADLNLSYCAHPPALEHGVVFCCDDKGDPAVANISDFCCWPGGSVQFECNPGYLMIAGEPVWHCSGDGTGGASHITSMPVCAEDYSTSPMHTDGQNLSDGMIKIMVAVTSGVLLLLLIVVAFAFCKPRLKEIKRRWRDFREDENELIVDGRRVYLPSYEQATSHNDSQGWCDYFQQVASSSNQVDESSDVTRPPQSNLVDIVTPSVPYASLSNELSPQSPPPMQYDADSDGGDQITVVEFLSEFPSTSAGITAELSGFEDNFVPIRQGSRNPITPDSPTSSLSSNEAISAPLLTESSCQRSKAKVKSKRSNTIGGQNQALSVLNPTAAIPQQSNNVDSDEIKSSNRHDYDEINPSIRQEAGDSLDVIVKNPTPARLLDGSEDVALDRISLNLDADLSVQSRDSIHADSTTV